MEKQKQHLYQEENTHISIAKLNVQTTVYEKHLFSKDSEHHLVIEKKKLINNNKIG